MYRVLGPFIPTLSKKILQRWGILSRYALEMILWQSSTEFVPPCTKGVIRISARGVSKDVISLLCSASSTRSYPDSKSTIDAIAMPANSSQTSSTLGRRLHL